MNNETIDNDIKKLTKDAFYRGLFWGLLPCLFLFSWFFSQILDLSDKYHLITTVNVGYTEDEIISRHSNAYTEIRTLDPQETYAVPGYRRPVPRYRQADKVLAIELERYLIYAFIVDGYVTGTYFTEEYPRFLPLFQDLIFWIR